MSSTCIVVDGTLVLTVDPTCADTVSVTRDGPQNAIQVVVTNSATYTYSAAQVRGLRVVGAGAADRVRIEPAVNEQFALEAAAAQLGQFAGVLSASCHASRPATSATGGASTGPGGDSIGAGANLVVPGPTRMTESHGNGAMPSTGGGAAAPSFYQAAVAAPQGCT